MEHDLSLACLLTNFPRLCRVLKANPPAHVYRHTLLACFCIAFAVHSFGQPGDPPMHAFSIGRSCLGAGGATQAIFTSNKEYYVSQSIGQSGVIGTYQEDGYTLLQGYQQPLMSPYKFQTTSDHQLRAVVYPNPFSESIQIDFKEPIDGIIYVMVSDMMGKTMISQKYPSTPLLRLPLNTIPEGLYVVKIEADNRYLIVKQVKQ